MIHNLIDLTQVFTIKKNNITKYECKPAASLVGLYHIVFIQKTNANK